MATVKRAAGLIIFRRITNEIEFLLLQTSYGEHHWTPPKGHLDPGETDMQAAIRETQEEAGLMKDQLNILKKFKAELNYNVRGKPKTVTYWLSELKDPNSPVTLSHEHIDFKWLRYKEALEIANYSDMQKALKEAFDFLTENEN